MKKILTLICFTGLLATGFAQSNEGNRRDDDRNRNNNKSYDKNRNQNDKRYDDHYSFNTSQRDMEIARVNREFDKKVADVQYSRMNPRQKRRLLSSLQTQRMQQISAINARFHEKRNRYGDYDQNKGRH